MPVDRRKALRIGSLRARGLLEPFLLPRIDRPQIRNRYLAAIARARQSGNARLIPVLGGAGLGKSTLLGAVWDAVNELGPTSLITCSEVSLPSEETAASVNLAFGRAFGLDMPLSDACRDAAGGGPSLLIIDTLDLILTKSTVVPLRHFFNDLLIANVTVLFSCRDFEYDHYFAAQRVTLPDIDRGLDSQFVPPFTMEEAEEAARRFAEVQHGPEIARNFAHSVKDVAADRRPIREIVQNPLLLAMLCNLFAAGGVVPPDLTVAALYERFWTSQVALTRRRETPEEAGPRKERICLALASLLLDASDEHFVETVAAGDLRDVTEDSVGQAALLELRSEGVLRERFSRFAFFHQTFAEFVVARLLAESSQAARLHAVLEKLQTRGEAEALHLWPVLRQLLVLTGYDSFRDIAARLAARNLAAFRAVTMAAATRTDGWDVLAGLVDSAVAGGPEFQSAYLLALETAAAGRESQAVLPLLKLIKEGDDRAATRASRVLGEFAARTDAIAFADILDVIDLRAGRGGNEFTRNEQQAAFMDGFATPQRRRDSRPSRLRELSGLLPRLTTPARERLIREHAEGSSSLADAEELLSELRAERLPKPLYQPAALLLRRTLGTRALHWRTLLEGEWKPGWQYARGQALGLLLRASPDLATDIVHLMLTADGLSVSACETAIASAGGNDVAVSVASAILADWEHAAARIRLTSDVIAEIAEGLPGEMRIALRERITPLVSGPDRKVVIALAALASTPDDERAVIAQLDRLPEDDVLDILPPMVRAFDQTLRTDALRDALALLGRASPGGKADLTRVRLVNLLPEPRRSETLTQLTTDRRFSAHADASAALAERIAPNASLSELVPMLARPQLSMRFHAIQALRRAAEAGGMISPEDLVAVAAYLRDEHDPGIIQELFNLATLWIRAQQTLPEELLTIIGSAFIPRLAGLHGGAQREAILFLKWAASFSEADTAPFARLRAMIVEVFRRLDFQRFHDGVTEGLEMLSHIARREPSFARSMVDEWEKQIARGETVAPYTLRSLVYLLNRTRDRDLYNRILLNPACPPAVGSLILKMLNM